MKDSWNSIALPKNLTPVELIDFCLYQMEGDKVKALDDRVCDGLYFGEVIGALLLAREELEKYNPSPPRKIHID